MIIKYNTNQKITRIAKSIRVLFSGEIMTLQEKIKEVCALMDPLIDDWSVPKNIRSKIAEAKERILNEKESPDIAIANAIYALDEASNDVNVPLHARTDVWNVISELEKLKKEISK